MVEMPMNRPSGPCLSHFIFHSHVQLFIYRSNNEPRHYVHDQPSSSRGSNNISGYVINPLCINTTNTYQDYLGAFMGYFLSSHCVFSIAVYICLVVFLSGQTTNHYMQNEMNNIMSNLFIPIKLDPQKSSVIRKHRFI